jgi:hypothetical protein
MTPKRNAGEVGPRIARVARINRKRPPYTVEVVREPEPDAREKLLDVLFDLLDPIVHSGQK